MSLVKHFDESNGYSFRQITCVFYNANTIFIIFSLTYSYLLYFNHQTTPLTIINKSILVSETHFTIKINNTNHFLNNCVKL